MPEPVRLALGGSITGELPINFVLDVRHGDESSDHTAPATRLDYCTASVSRNSEKHMAASHTACGDRAIVYVTSGRETGSAVGLREEERKLSAGRVGVDDVAFVLH